MKDSEGIDKKYMQRCFDLAMLGIGNTSPNPLVGSVLVFDNKIIGEGYHQRHGGPHAEANAIKAVKNHELLQYSTLYVNLEPCPHFGKTPPCTNLIIEKKIPRVVISCEDTSLKVSGRGIDMLKESGCKVVTGVLEKEGRDLNRRFFTFHEKNRPYIILKWAMTMDGFIDVRRAEKAPVKPTWITSETTRALVHKWRVEEQAIIVGTNTAMKDNPHLTARDWPGKNPVRVVIDKSLKLCRSLSLFDNSAKTIVFTEAKNITPEECCEKHPLLEIIGINFEDDMIKPMLDILYNKGIQSLIVEGGAKLLNSLITTGIWDEARVFTGSINFYEGVRSPEINSKVISSEYLIDSILTIYKNSSVKDV